MINRTDKDQLEILLLLSMCSVVAGAHMRHAATFDGWFPNAPMKPEYREGRETDEHDRFFRLWEDGKTEFDTVLGSSGERKGEIADALYQISDGISKMIPARDAPGRVALLPIGNLIYELKDTVLLTSKQQSIVDRTLNIFSHHDVPVPCKSERVHSDRVLLALGEIGLFVNTDARAA